MELSVIAGADLVGAPGAAAAAGGCRGAAAGPEAGLKAAHAVDSAKAVRRAIRVLITASILYRTPILRFVPELTARELRV
jgi:hypothetical protein